MVTLLWALSAALRSFYPGSQEVYPWKIVWIADNYWKLTEIGVIQLKRDSESESSQGAWQEAMSIECQASRNQQVRSYATSSLPVLTGCFISCLLFVC
jgi:hypothetical protein